MISLAAWSGWSSALGVVTVEKDVHDIMCGLRLGLLIWPMRKGGSRTYDGKGTARSV